MRDRIFKTKLSEENWDGKYRYDNEAPMGTQDRCANALASVEKAESQQYWKEKFLNTLVNIQVSPEAGDDVMEAIGLKFTPGGRITANIGTTYAGTTLMNCFINGPVSNVRLEYERIIPGTDVRIPVVIQSQSSSDSLVNIMITALEQAETLKSEGGYGINFDFIRPRGALIESIGIEHPGVVKYMEIWDKISEVIVMGNNDGYRDILKNLLPEASRPARKRLEKKVKKMARKGAMMGVLSIWHPDAEEFIRAKQTSGRLTKFNISVMVDDKFMQAVEDDTEYDQHFNGVVYKTIKARELYDLIMQSTYNRAEPGILFYDNMQRNNPISYLGPINATNPCGEIGGNPATTTVCLLMSVNLTQYVRADRTFDWDRYKEDLAIAARMCDNVNDLVNNPLPSYNWATKNIRQYGMGINGLGSTLYMMGIAYNSPEGVEFNRQVNWWKEEITWRTSALLAEEKGPFPMYDAEQFLNTHWFTKFTKISKETKDLIRKHGVRNAKTTTNPPLGNSSIICDVISNGIEPVFMHEYQRKYISPSWPDGLTLDNVKTLLKETTEGDAVVWQGEFNGVKYHYEPHNRGLCVIENVRDFGYQWVMDHFPGDVEAKAEYLVTTQNLSVSDHVEMQVVTQENINQSVSKTANIPNDYPFEDFKKLYLEAWRRGLNGFTTYREGSMESVLSKIEEKKELDTITRQVIKGGLVLPEEYLNGPGKTIEREGMKFYIHMSYALEDTNMEYPIALWITTNHKGETVAANAAVKSLASLLRSFEIDSDLVDAQAEKLKGQPSHEKVGRMVSMCLRHNLPTDSIVAALEGLEGDWISSLLTAVRKFLTGLIKDGTVISGKKCDRCGSTKIIYESGCAKCLDCGSSNCG